MATKKFLDDNGLLYYHQRVRTLIDAKQNTLTPEQLAVLNANPFTNADQTKLNGIETGAQINSIESISLNGTGLVPDGNLNVDITVPTHLNQLNPAGFQYVASIAAGSSNVVIGGTPTNPTITVSAQDMPEDFTSTETPTGAIGTLLTGMDALALTPVIPGATLSVGDNIIFANNIQAIVSSITGDQYDAVISRIPAEVSFPSITGNPMDNTALAALFNTKLNTNLGSTNADMYLQVQPDGSVGFGAITSITNAEIDTIMA